MMLKVGRHIRPNQRYKMIIAREEGEVNFLEGYRNQYTNLYPTSCNGPLAIIDGKPNQKDLKTAAKILARYSQGRETENVEVIKSNESCTLSIGLNCIIGKFIPVSRNCFNCFLHSSGVPEIQDRKSTRLNSSHT